MALDDAGPTYHSRHGGLWIDRSDWREQAAKKRLSPQTRDRLNAFVADGFVILPNAASHAAIDAFLAKISAGFESDGSGLLYQNPGDNRCQPLSAGVRRLGTRIVDAYAVAHEALDLFTSPSLLAFLELIFGEEAMLFQSLGFDQGSQQGLHQDTAYVVVDRPLELAACWIALEDIRPGSGELMYAPGSHRAPEFSFSPDRKHWEAPVDGDAIHHQWSQLLVQRAQETRGVQTFMARKGDILVWHADLAHGGKQVERQDLTRRSLVGHFCPRSARPHYLNYRADRREVRRYGRLSYCSEHYDLAALPEPATTAFLGWRQWLRKWTA